MPDAPVKEPEERTKNPVIEETRTSIDTLLELLRKKGRMEINNIAVDLSIDPRILESWAKVLEKGDLIKIRYEVGKMYLEPVNLAPEEQKNLQTKTELSTFIMGEDLAVERISLDKFAKNINDLDSTISNVEKLYQQKFPTAQKILLELDKVYAQLEAKKKGVEKLKSDADYTLQDVNKKVDDLISKVEAFSPKQSEIDMKDKEARASTIIENINKTQLSISETERSERKFFDDMERQLNTQVDEFKKKISGSRRESEKVLLTSSKQLDALIKAIKDQSANLQDVTKEADEFGREVEKTKRYLKFVKSDFGDKFEKIKIEADKNVKLMDEQSGKISSELDSIRQSISQTAKLADDIKKWKKAVEDVNKEINTTRNEIAKISAQLKALEADKRTSVEEKAKTIKNLVDQTKETKSSTSKTKGAIKDLANELLERAEKK